jgi:4'-phosphopantetheinyl transferase
MEQTMVYWALTETLVRDHGPFLASLLDQRERSRADRLRYAADRDAFVAAHGLLRLALSAASAGDPRAWEFAQTPSGKPELAGARGGLTFSLSHARTIVACAVAPAGTIGVDVEEIPATPSDEALIRQCCTLAERAQLHALPAGAAATAFVRLWTMKEAVMKALGTGLALPPEEIACTLEPPAILSSGDDRRAWDVVSLQPTVRHVLTAARPAAAHAAGSIAVHRADARLPALR